MSWVSHLVDKGQDLVRHVDPVARYTDEKIWPAIKGNVTTPALHFVRRQVGSVANVLGLGNTYDAAFGRGDQPFGINTFWDYVQHPNSGGKPAIDANKAGMAIAGGYALNGLLGGSAAGASEGSGSGMFGGGSLVNAGMGLLGNGQPQQQVGGSYMPQQSNPQSTEAARIRMAQEMQLQALRQKPNKTMEDWAILQQQVQNPGLLYG